MHWFHYLLIWQLPFLRHVSLTLRIVLHYYCLNGMTGIWWRSDFLCKVVCPFYSSDIYHCIGHNDFVLGACIEERKKYLFIYFCMVISREMWKNWEMALSPWATEKTVIPTTAFEGVRPKLLPSQLSIYSVFFSIIYFLGQRLERKYNKSYREGDVPQWYTTFLVEILDLIPSTAKIKRR